MLARALLVLALGVLATARTGRAEPAPLAVIATIPLPQGKGRIDHLALDARRQRLFVAELGNDSVAVVDLAGHRLERRLADIAGPQGIAYLAATDTLYVASGGDGKLQAFRGTDLDLVNSIDLGDDADNVRVAADANRIYVGFGDGIAALDARTLELLGRIPLKGHPEGFQLSAVDSRIFVNVPDSREVAVADRDASRQVASWSAEIALANYPMALNAATEELLSVFRMPARIISYRMSDGTVARSAETCRDADDLFVDAKRSRAYVICGEGLVDVRDSTTLRRIASVPTSKGARTGLYSAEADLLFVAVRQAGTGDAAVWVLKPND